MGNEKKLDANEHMLHDSVYIEFKKLTSGIQSQINGYLWEGRR